MSRDSVEAAVSQFSLEYHVGSYYAGPNSIAVPFAPAVTPRWNFDLPFRGIFNATTGKYKEKKNKCTNFNHQEQLILFE